MSNSAKGPFYRCIACDGPLPEGEHFVLAMKAPEGDQHDYNGCYEDVCPSCKAATQRAYDLDYTRWDGLWDFSQDIGPAYGEIG